MAIRIETKTYCFDDRNNKENTFFEYYLYNINLRLHNKNKSQQHRYNKINVRWLGEDGVSLFKTGCAAEIRLS